MVDLIHLLEVRNKGTTDAAARLFVRLSSHVDDLQVTLDT